MARFLQQSIMEIKKQKNKILLGLSPYKKTFSLILLHGLMISVIVSFLFSHPISIKSILAFGFVYYYATEELPSLIHKVLRNK